MRMVRPDAEGNFEQVLNPGDYILTFGELPSNLRVKRVTLDDKPIVNLKFSIESAADPKQLTIVLAPSTQQ